MGKYVFIAEKPSVAKEFAKVLGVNGNAGAGFMESDKYIVTWCVGHLVTMSYPDAYDPKLKKWDLETIPFLPKKFKYEVIDGVKKQFNIVKNILTGKDIERIYVCTDSGREGEYIYRLVDMVAKVPDTIDKRRVWIDSQTEEEIKRGIKEAKPLAEYNSLSDAAYLRAKEDYLMGINFSRALTLRYGYKIKNELRADKNVVISCGRVMTCVLGMVVRREREIRDFVKTPFYRVFANLEYMGQSITGEFKAVKGSIYENSPLLYKENGFKKKEDAEKLIEYLEDFFKENERVAIVEKCEKKTEKKNPPMLFNLAEAQNVCSKLFKISPDETLNIIQNLYESKLVTYPRTDARVLSTAVCKEIHKNLKGLLAYDKCADVARKVLDGDAYKNIAKTRYCDDKKITDHYAIIPTGQGLNNLGRLSALHQKVYEVIVRRFLCIFFPAAEYKKISLDSKISTEHFFSSFKVLVNEGYMAYQEASFAKKNRNKDDSITLGSGKDNGDSKVTEGVDVGNTGSAGNTNGAGNTGGAGNIGSAGNTGGAGNIGSSGNTGGTGNNGGAGNTGGAGNAGNADLKGSGDNSDEGDGDVTTSEAFIEQLSKLKKGAKLDCKDFEIKEGETSPPKRYNSGSLILAMENAGQLIEDEELRAEIKSSGIGTSATRAEILSKLVKIKYLSLNKKTQIITCTTLGEMVYEVTYYSIRPLLDPKLTASWEKGLTMVANQEISENDYMVKLEDYVSRRVNYVKHYPNMKEINESFKKIPRGSSKK